MAPEHKRKGKGKPNEAAVPSATATPAAPQPAQSTSSAPTVGNSKAAASGSTGTPTASASGSAAPASARTALVAARAVPVAPPPERRIGFAANATADDKRRAVARLLAAQKGDVGAQWDVAQWYAAGVVLERSDEAYTQWIEHAAKGGCVHAME